MSSDAVVDWVEEGIDPSHHHHHHRVMKQNGQLQFLQEEDDSDFEGDRSIINNHNALVITLAALLPFTQEESEMKLRIRNEEEKQEEGDGYHEHEHRKVRRRRRRAQHEELRSSNVFNDAAAILIAMEDWNHEHSESNRSTDNCTIQLQLEFWDSQGSRVESSKLLNDILLPRATSRTTSNSSTVPSIDGFVAHDIYSQITSPIATLVGNPRIPFLTTSTLDDLRSQHSYPTVGRTMATNAHRIAQELYSSVWGANHTAVLYGRDLFGTSVLPRKQQHSISVSTSTDFAHPDISSQLPLDDDVLPFTTRNNTDIDKRNETTSTKQLSIQPIPFGEDISIEDAMINLSQTKIRTIYVICQTYQFEMILEEAVRQDLVGHDYQWLFHGPDLNILHESGILKQSNPVSLLARALQGVGILTPVGDGISMDPFFPDMPRQPTLASVQASLDDSYEYFRRRWRTTVAQDPTFHDKLSSNLPINTTTTSEWTFYLEPPTYAPFLYDAIWSFGKSVCETVRSKPKDNKTGEGAKDVTNGSDNVDGSSSDAPAPGTKESINGVDIINEFRELDFRGPSGLNSFDRKKTVRRHQDFVVWNILQAPSEQKSFSGDDDNKPIQFGIYPSLHLQHKKPSPKEKPVPRWKTLRPFQFTTKGSHWAPNSIPPVEYNYHYIGVEGRVVAYSAMAITMVAALLSVVWIRLNRRERAVRSAQPSFLIMISVGGFATAAALFPLGIDDSFPGITQNGLDISCNTIPWVYVIGIVCTWSALTAKARGVYEAYMNPDLDCVLVSGRDLVVWYALTMSLNVALLIAWQVVAPLKFERYIDEDGGTDEWDRHVDSYSVCSSDNARGARFFAIPLAFFNVFSVSLGCWRAWKTRNIETEYKESRYVGLSLAFLLQAWFLGYPLIMITWFRSDARFYVSLGTVFVSSMVSLATIYIPKIFAISTDQRIQREHQAKIDAQWQIEAKRRKRQARHSLAGDYPQSHEALSNSYGVLNLLPLDHSESHGTGNDQGSKGEAICEISDYNEITWSSGTDAIFPAPPRKEKSRGHQRVADPFSSISAYSSSLADSASPITELNIDSADGNPTSPGNAESDDDNESIILEPPQLNLSSLGDSLASIAKSVLPRRSTFPKFAFQLDSFERQKEVVIAEDSSHDGSAITTKMLAPSRGIKINFNPRSRRNLEMAGGRELSRHQLFHLQLKGEYIDDADFGNGHDYEGTILPLMDTTMPTTAEDPHLERLREEEERAEQEIIFENYTNTFEDYSVELKGDD